MLGFYLNSLMMERGPIHISRTFGSNTPTLLYYKHKNTDLDARFLLEFLMVERRPIGISRTFGSKTPALLYYRHKKTELDARFFLNSCDGGEGGIRTPDTLLTYTHFPGVRFQPLSHLSALHFL